MIEIATVVLLLGVLSSLASIGEAFSLHKQKLFTFILILWTISIIQYSLIDQHFIVAISVVGVIRTFMVLYSVKYAWLNHVLFIPFFLAVHTTLFIIFSDWDTITWFNFIPLVAIYGGTISGFFKNLIYIKMISISNGSLWLFYQYSLGLYGQIPGETINFMINIWAIIVLIQAFKKGVPLNEVKEVNVRIMEYFSKRYRKVRRISA